jgi:hypothetical protein
MTLATSDKSLYGYTPQYAPLEQVNGEGTTAQSRASADSYGHAQGEGESERLPHADSRDSDEQSFAARERNTRAQIEERLSE